jgi:hypothetical protein
MRPDIVVASEQIAWVVPPLDRREPLIGLRRVDSGDVLVRGRREGVGVGTIDVRWEPLRDQR